MLTISNKNPGNIANTDVNKNKKGNSRNNNDNNIILNTIAIGGIKPHNLLVEILKQLIDLSGIFSFLKNR